MPKLNYYLSYQFITARKCIDYSCVRTTVLCICLDVFTCRGSITKGAQAFLNQQPVVYCAANEDQVSSMEAQGDKRNQAVTAQDYQQQIFPPLQTKALSPFIFS